MSDDRADTGGSDEGEAEEVRAEMVGKRGRACERVGVERPDELFLDDDLPMLRV